MTLTEKMISAINDGALALMTAVGHRTGLFRTMAELPPSTSAEIAARASLNERYVREWLGAMVVEGVVTFDPEFDWYMLPCEHARVLEEVGKSAGLLALAAGLDKHFRCGSCMPVSALDRFREATAPAAETMRRALQLVPGLCDRLEDGLDVADVSDVRRGNARAYLERGFESSRFESYDLNNGALPALLHKRDSYDLVTAFASIQGPADPVAVLSHLHDALREKGLLVMLEVAASSRLENNIGHPTGALIYATSCMLSNTLPRINLWGEERAREMLSEAGFRRVVHRRLSGDVERNCFIAQKC